jgi:hypothetical protein
VLTDADGIPFNSRHVIFFLRQALLFGGLTIGLGFAAQHFGDLILQIALSIFGFVGGPLFALLILGVFFPFVNSWVTTSVSVLRIHIKLFAHFSW